MQQLLLHLATRPATAAPEAAVKCKAAAVAAQVVAVAATRVSSPRSSSSRSSSSSKGGQRGFRTVGSSCCCCCANEALAAPGAGAGVYVHPTSVYVHPAGVYLHPRMANRIELLDFKRQRQPPLLKSRTCSESRPRGGLARTWGGNSGKQEIK